MAALGANMGANLKKKTEAKKPEAVQKKAMKRTAGKKKAPVSKKPKVSQKEKVTEEEVVLQKAALILEPSKRKKIRKTKVILEGELGIKNAAAFQKKIIPVFDDYDYVDFFLKDVTVLDLSYIQMLYYLKKHFQNHGKVIKIDSALSAEVKKIVVRAGFEELMFVPKLT